MGEDTWNIPLLPQTYKACYLVNTNNQIADIYLLNSTLTNKTNVNDSRVIRQCFSITKKRWCKKTDIYYKSYHFAKYVCSHVVTYTTKKSTIKIYPMIPPSTNIAIVPGI